ncbi:MAG TPA: hypothetical protein VLE70_05010, partial [Anaerolineae bacterium]|nr:hypothetical protein [Anaerolineae bacterium]
YTCNSTQPPFGGRSTPISSVYGDCLGNIYCDATFAGSVTFSIEATRMQLHLALPDLSIVSA